MKNMLLLLFLAPAFIAGCKSTAPDPGTEEQSIRLVIEQETNAYLKQDLVQLMKYIAQDDHAIRISVGSNGYKERIGWENIYSFYRASAAADWKDYSNYKIERYNWHFKVSGNIALVYFDQKMDFNYKNEPMNTHSKELRVMEKIKGDWKILLVQWADMSFFEKSDVDLKTF